MRNLSELYLRCSKLAPSVATIHAFEAHFQVNLPADYRHFLSLANGGEPMLDSTFDYTTALGKLVTEADQVKEFLSLTDDTEDWGSVWRNTQLLRDTFSKWGRETNVICIGTNGEGDMIYLDFGTATPCVYIHYWDFAETRSKIASSFETFIENLHPRR